MKKSDYLKKPVEHFDIKNVDTTKLVDSMKLMGFTSRDLGRATEIFVRMIEDPKCTVALTIAGSTSAAGCMNLYSDLVKYNMVDVIVATGATIVDMDFFEALGFKHYQGEIGANDAILRDLYIDRIYDTYIDEDELQVCDNTIQEIADKLETRPYSSREFIKEMGQYLVKEKKDRKKNSLVETAYKHNVPIFCPAFSDSSAGFGLVMHQARKPDQHVTLDSVRDFRELTEIKIQQGDTGMLIIGGGVPKNFWQDTVVCAEMLGHEVGMHKYAIQITVADVRDGACSSSTLREAHSWGKVDTTYEQMVYAEATSVLPLLASYAYHNADWKNRKRRDLSKLFDVK